MNLDEIDKEILSMATEDLNGLWEPIWYFQNKDFLKNKNEIHDQVKKSILKLLANNLIYLCKYNISDNIELIIHESELQGILDSDLNWIPPDKTDDLQIRFCSTSLGEQIYYSQSIT